jgi:hypothetical protein
MKKKELGATITDTKDFAGVIKDIAGVKHLMMRSATYFQHELNKFKDGENVSVYISTRRPKRSERQNRYYWGAYLPIIARETGENDLERLHLLYKGKFLTTGIVEVLGNKVRMMKSTTSLSKSEFIEYIMKIEAETGIEAPPTDNWDIDNKEYRK